MDKNYPTLTALAIHWRTSKTLDIPFGGLGFTNSVGEELYRLLENIETINTHIKSGVRSE